MTYLTLELQKVGEGDIAHLVTLFTTRAEAEAKYHTILGYAAVSTIPVHSAILMNEEGAVLRSETYKHDGSLPEGMEGESVFPTNNGEIEI